MRATWLLATLLGLTQGETEIETSGSPDDCTKFCDSTLNAGACGTGCRLWSITHMTDNARSRQAIDADCRLSCDEAYSAELLRSSCRQGCSKQKPMLGPQSVEMIVTSFDDQPNEVWNRLGNFKDSIFTGDVFKNIFGSQNPFEAMEKEMNNFQEEIKKMTSSSGRQNPLFNYAETLGNKNANSNPISNTHSDGFPIIFVELEELPMKGLSNERARVEESRREGWMVEMESRWGLRQAFVCVGLSLSALAFIYLSLVVLRTAPRRRLLKSRAEALAALAKSKMAAYPSSGEKAFLVPNEVIQPPPSYEELEPAKIHQSTSSLPLKDAL